MCVKDWEDTHRREQQFVDDMVSDFSNLDISEASNATVPSDSSWEEMMNFHGIDFGSSSSSYTRSELENYYETNFSACFAIGPDGRHDFTNFDLLLFWKAQSIAFPVLYPNQLHFLFFLKWLVIY